MDGDSASSTELYALLSSLAEVPIKQGIAVTGSVNQNGEIQAIGGINHKIEGHFDICRLKGLTGEQGVMMPYSNRRNLMLRPDVIDAVKAGKSYFVPGAWWRSQTYLLANQVIDDLFTHLTDTAATTPILEMPFWLFFAPLVLGSLLLAVETLAMLVHTWRSRRPGDKHTVLT